MAVFIITRLYQNVFGHLTQTWSEKWLTIPHSFDCTSLFRPAYTPLRFGHRPVWLKLYLCFQ